MTPHTGSNITLLFLITTILQAANAISDALVVICITTIHVNSTVTQLDNIYLWFVIPQLFNGLSSLLISMTVFEFICAVA